MMSISDNKECEVSYINAVFIVYRHMVPVYLTTNIFTHAQAMLTRLSSQPSPTPNLESLGLRLGCHLCYVSLVTFMGGGCSHNW